jgi:hypothetical protein
MGSGVARYEMTTMARGQKQKEEEEAAARKKAGFEKRE